MKQHGESAQDKSGHWGAMPGATQGGFINIGDVGRLTPALEAMLNLLEEILKELRIANARRD